MKKHTRIARQMVMAFLALSLAGCANQAERKDDAKFAQLFVDAHPFLGQKVTVEGYLRYEFENRNLFPTSDKGGSGRQGYCLPVLIERDRQDVLTKAEQLSGEVVRISGTIVDPTPPGLKSLGTCKDIGIVPDSIELTK
ncbi:hypothetical protein [Dyella sp. AD56]|uniref:hypothetical protein n=1 Tax=Dyella sp. AD56 TaxID=1528744 RepID=UPI000C84543F|nr:hypothetical protein [Dyella sp. AD56]